MSWEKLLLWNVANPAGPSEPLGWVYSRQFPFPSSFSPLPCLLSRMMFTLSSNSVKNRTWEKLCGTFWFGELIHCCVRIISKWCPSWVCSCFRAWPHSDESEVAQLHLTLCDPMVCSLPGSFIHEIFQARVLEWVAIAFSTEWQSHTLTIYREPAILQVEMKFNYKTLQTLRKTILWV